MKIIPIIWKRIWISKNQMKRKHKNMGKWIPLILYIIYRYMYTNSSKIIKSNSVFKGQK